MRTKQGSRTRLSVRYTWVMTGILLLVSATACLAQFSPSPEGEAGSLLAGLRRAGLSGDRSNLPALIAVLKQDDDASLATAAHALAHLGATEALPELDACIARHPDNEFLKLQRARLLAEAAAMALPSAAPTAKTDAAPNPNAAPTGRTTETTKETNKATPQERDAMQTRVHVFLQKAGLDAATLSSKAKTYFAQNGRDKGWSKEVYALNELADMAYRGSWDAAQNLLEFKALDFSVEPSIAVKMRYAAVPPAQRAKKMLDELAAQGRDRLTDADVATVKPGLSPTDALTQLAIDEGPRASRYAARKLDYMDAHRSEFTVEGYYNLFNVLAGVGDKAQTALIARYLEDEDVSNGASSALMQIQHGFATQRVVGF